MLTSPKVVPKMVGASDDVSTATRFVRALSAAAESEPVNATVWATTIDPGVTESIVTLQTAFKLL